MKKVLSKRLPEPSRIVRKEMSHDPTAAIREIETLRRQIDSLKAALNSLKIDTENKETKLASLAREKEKLSMSLAKVRRSNEALSQQLEDERHFYFKEKEMYCREMNEYKRLKKTLSRSDAASNFDDGGEVEKLRKTLEHALQTNYNLSVKFLRMRETKNVLSTALNKTEEEHRQVLQNLKAKIDNLSQELREIMNQKFDDPLSPSNKKYLQLVNRNSSLVYENLQLQIKIDQLSFHLRRGKVQRTKSETNARILHRCGPKRAKVNVAEQQVIKIYEKDETSGSPRLAFLNEKKKALRLHSSERKLRLPDFNESKLEVFQISALQSRGSEMDVAARRRRSRSAPKIVQSVTFNDSTTSTRRGEDTK